MDGNMEPAPMISVIMPVGGIDQYLEEALSSVNAQTFRDFELIVVCDETLRKELQGVLDKPQYAFRKRIIGSRLKGFAFAVNLGIESAEGQYIARWDADDLCDANRFERQIGAFAEQRELGVVGTRGVLIDDAGQVISHHRFRFYQNDEAIRGALRYRQPLLHTSVMFRAQVLFDNGGYKYGHSSEDHELYLRIARDRSVKFANLPDVVSYYRRHRDQLTNPARRYEQFCDISGFMTTELLRTGNPSYIVGALATVPFAREFRRLFRQAVRRLSR